MAFRKTWVFSFLLLFLGCGENDNPINQPNFKLKQHKQTLKYNKKDCTNNQILNLVNSKTLNPKNLKEMGIKGLVTKRLIQCLEERLLSF